MTWQSAPAAGCIMVIVYWELIYVLLQ